MNIFWKIVSKIHVYIARGFPSRRIFLDYASTTPVDGGVYAVMAPYFSDLFHNPSAIYKEGVHARKVVEYAREKVARLIGARAEEIIFTSGGTESANLAIKGIFEANSKPHIIATEIEHPAVLEACRDIVAHGGTVTFIKPKEDGRVSPQDIVNAITPETVLIAVMHVNNEIGTIQPLKDISRAVQDWKNKNTRNPEDKPYIYTDASQSANYLDIRKESLGVDMITLDGSKIYGPKGVGILFKKHYVNISPITHGGSQEKGLRPGTENVPLIVGFAHALELATKKREKENARVKEIRDYALALIGKVFEGKYIVNGSIENRIANNINFCIKNMNAELMVIRLDAYGIACSSVTACKNPDEDPVSHVIEALPDRESFKSSQCASSSLRITFGKKSTKQDVRTFVYALDRLLNEYSSEK